MQDNGDLTVFYLKQLSAKDSATSSTQVPDPLPFSAPHQAIVVNVLWVLSLLLSLGCALGATLVQTWTGRYLRVIALVSDTDERARYRAQLRS